MYLIRLDDYAENCNVENWNRIEIILDTYGIKPIVAVIPNNQDADLKKYDFIENFWEKVKTLEKKGYQIAMHGYDHVYISKSGGGINPINLRSEFAGVELSVQEDKIKKSYSIFVKNNIEPKIFVAPSHTFDLNTLISLKKHTNIRIISDTIANDIYYYKDFYFIPQQVGRVRKVRFKTTTFCYHPNTMIEKDFEALELFIKENPDRFIRFNDLNFTKRKRNLVDWFYKKLYFLRRKVHRLKNGK